MSLISILARAEEVPHGAVQFICNARESSVQIGNDFDNSLVPTKAIKRRYVKWSLLLIAGPQTNQSGDPLRTGSRLEVHRCGLLTVRFRSGFLNSNPQGELGAIDFGVVEVVRGKKVIVSPTALESCEMAFSRYQYFGACPDAWAQNISVRWDESTGKAKVTLMRSYTDDAYERKIRLDEREVP